MAKKYLVAFYLLSVLISIKIGNAQSILEVTDSVFATTPADNNGIHFRILANSWEKIDLSTGTKEVYLVPGIGSYTRLYDLIVNKQGLFFISIMGGEVFEIRESGVLRIDKSYNHRMQSYSAMFSRNDTIFRHGGYGFWSARHMITFFDYRTKQWELYPAKISENKLPAIYEHQYYLSGDSLLVFGGWKIDASSPLYPVHNNEVWLFDFISKSWKYLGMNSWKNSNYQRASVSILKTGNQSFITGYGPLVHISLSDNLIRNGQFSDKILYWILERNVMPFRFKDHIYFYRSNTNARGRHEFCVISESELIASYAEAEKWIDTPTQFPTELIYLLGVLPFIGFYFIVRQRKIRSVQKPLMVNADSGSDGGTFEFDSVEQGLVELFLSSFPNNLTIAQVDEVLETAHKSRDAQNQRRSQVIRLINLKFMAMTSFKSSLILSKRSGIDARMMEYYLDPLLQPALAELLRGRYSSR